jgi:hypothetical protein
MLDSMQLDLLGPHFSHFQCSSFEILIGPQVFGYGAEGSELAPGALGSDRQ